MGKSVFNAIGWFTPIVIAVAATPWLIRMLGAGSFGVFSICLLLATLVPSLDLGFGTAATRQIAAARNDRDQVASVICELLGLALVLAAISFVVLYGARTVVSRWLSFDAALPAAEATSLLVSVAVWIAAGYLSSALAVLPRADERFSMLAGLSVASSTVLWVGAVLIVSAGFGLRHIMQLGIALAIGTGAFLYVANARRLGRALLPSFRWTNLRSQRPFAIHSFVSNLASIATYHADKAIVSALLGPAPAGLYNAGAGVASKLVGLSAALAGVLFPRVAHQHAQTSGPYRVARLYLVTNRLMLAVNTSLASTGLVLAERFLTLWLGELATAELVFTFRLLILAYWMASWSVVAANVLSGTGSAGRAAFFSTAGGLITVSTALLLVPRLGLVGAAVAGVLGMSQALLFDLLLERDLRRAHRLSGFRRLETLGACAASGGAAACCAYFAGQWIAGWTGLVLSGAAALAVAVAVWFALGFAGREERVLLWRYLDRIGLRSR